MFLLKSLKTGYKFNISFGFNDEYNKIESCIERGILKRGEINDLQLFSGLDWNKDAFRCERITSLKIFPNDFLKFQQVNEFKNLRNLELELSDYKIDEEIKKVKNIFSIANLSLNFYSCRKNYELVGKILPIFKVLELLKFNYLEYIDKSTIEAIKQ